MGTRSKVLILELPLPLRYGDPTIGIVMSSYEIKSPAPWPAGNLDRILRRLLKIVGSMNSLFSIHFMDFLFAPDLITVFCAALIVVCSFILFKHPNASCVCLNNDQVSLKFIGIVLVHEGT